MLDSLTVFPFIIQPFLQFYLEGDFNDVFSIKYICQKYNILLQKNIMYRKNILVIVIVVGIIFTYLFHKEKFLIPVSRTQILMDTVVTVKVYGNDRKYLETILDEVFSKIKNLSELLNNYNKKSEIHKINANAGIAPVKVSSVTIDFLLKSKALCLQTDGYLDITIGNTLNLWGFATDTPHVPEESDLKESLKYKGLNLIKIDKNNSTVFILKKNVDIDVGAVAKGYIIDKVVEFLQSKKIVKAVVNAGGDIRFVGFKDKGKSWRVGIRNPLSNNESSVIKVINIGDWSVVTSGDYERYFIKNGKRYHHIINPFTGFPANKVHSVTVTAENAFLADGIATAVFVMGDELFFNKYYNIFSKTKHFRVIIIKDNNTIVDSANFKALQ